MEKEIKIVIVFLVLLAAAASCKKFVAVSVPRDRVIASNVFETDAKATSAVTAVYGNIINGSSSFANSLAALCAGLSSDELAKFNPSATEQEFMANALTPANSNVSALWKSAYQSVYYANAVIEGLDHSASVTPKLKDQLQGEAKFIRAFCYFYLVNFFGDVPLVTSTAYNSNAALPRSAKSNLYALIIKDLTDAKEQLPITYSGAEKNRPNKYTASTLLARVYLYLADWTNAEAEATTIINSNLYTPPAAPKHGFS